MTSLSTRELVHATGATGRMVQYWCEHGLLHPSVELGSRAFTPDDVMRVILILKLRRKRISFQKIRIVLRTIARDARADGNSAPYLLMHGRAIHTVHTAREVVDELKSAREGAYLVAVP